MSIKKIFGVVLLAWAISTHSCCGSSCDNPSGSLTVEPPVEICEIDNEADCTDCNCHTNACENRCDSENAVERCPEIPS